LPISGDVKLGNNVRIPQPTLVEPLWLQSRRRNVEMRKNAFIGAGKISSHSFVCERVTIDDEAFIGHGVMFSNDRVPRATTDGKLQTEADWTCIATPVKKGASIATGAVTMCGVTIGAYSIVGARAVLTHDVPDVVTVAGVPARVMNKEHRLSA
jgi:UDP-2-acetamido-3-amino-2,3-dideoxy-glucuronate N-acetyltransferase